jgi:hypothetical protein
MWKRESEESCEICQKCPYYEIIVEGIMLS